MCRILYLESKRKTQNVPVLKEFARMAKESREYQGHGWGCAWWADDHWDFYWSIRPVWEDSFEHIPAAKRLLVHARSAFRDRDIAIQNNMPFTRENLVFAFNGELHGVRIREEGRIGAEKIFNFVLRFYRSDLLTAVKKAVPVICKKSRYVRAMNFVLASSGSAILVSRYNEQADYFTMYESRSSDRFVVCSEPLNFYNNWQPIANGTIKEMHL